MIYFDHNATSPILPLARDAWIEATEVYIGNPSSPHRIGSRAETALNRARESLALMLGCDALDLVWTSGATEANNAVLHHSAREAGPDSEIWVSSIEHPSVIEPVNHYFAARTRFIPVSHGGVVEIDWIAQNLLKSKPALIAVMAANNETGVIQPWKKIGELCRQAGVPYFCDATQWIGKAPAKGLGDCDFVTGAAHKFGGPRGVGFLKCPPKGRFNSMILGGPQEEGRRAGTENVPGVFSMMRALEIRNNQIDQGQIEHSLALKEKFERRLLETLPGTEIVGGREPRLWNTTMALMPEADCQQRWVVKLDKLGCAVSTGSACSSGKEKPSHVLNATGYPAPDAARALRFSANAETKAEEWDALLDALAKIHAGLNS